MKNILACLLAVIILSCPLTVCTAGGGDGMAGNGVSASLNIGDYILLGKYNDVPILWRYVADDENGMLILSDKILCFKDVGPTNFWAESYLRKWLNSDVPEGEVDWSYIVSYASVGDVRYNFDQRGSQFNREKGFLHKDNFSPSERAVMKPVTQWTMLPKNHLDLSENGETRAYNPVKETVRGPGANDPGGAVFYDISELPEVYVGAAHQVKDTVFLLDEMQVYRIWRNFGTVEALGVPEAWTEPPTSYRDEYALRTPYREIMCDISYDGRYRGYGGSDYGIRPAFYLNEANAVILSGSGTENDPYVIGGIAVLCNGSFVQFDQPPVLENDRVLVPMRAIFEALGAEVSWDESTQTVAAVKDGTTITLQIGSCTMTKNGEAIELDVAPKLVGGRTLVPVRAVSEGLGANVEWNEETRTVTVTTD